MNSLTVYTCARCGGCLPVENPLELPSTCPACERPTTWKKQESNSTAAPAHDPVNRPRHYQSENGVEAIDAIEAALGREGCMMFCRGSAMKYLFRGGKKDDTVQDLKKAAWYIGHEVKLRSAEASKSHFEIMT